MYIISWTVLAIAYIQLETGGELLARTVILGVEPSVVQLDKSVSSSSVILVIKFIKIRTFMR